MVKDKIAGIAEIAEIAKVSRQTVINWRNRYGDFPQPIQELKSGPVWNFNEIVKWASENNIPLQDPDETDPEDNLNYKRGTTVSFVNMKGGVGKTTITYNVGWYCAYYRKMKVLFVDLDPQFNLSQYALGQKKYEELIVDGNHLTVADIMQPNFNDSDSRETMDMTVSDCIVNVQSYQDGSKVDIVPSSLDLALVIKKSVPHADRLAQYLSKVKDQYDLILIDCPPTDSILTDAAYLASQFVMVPVLTKYLSAIGLPLLTRSINNFETDYDGQKVEIAGVLYNSTDNDEERARAINYIRGVTGDVGWYVFESELTYSSTYGKGSMTGNPLFLTKFARYSKITELKMVTDEFLRRIRLK